MSQHLVRTIEQSGLIEKGERLVVGVSGGADSLALLHALARLREPLGLELYVGHLNHCLRGGEADADAEFVRQIGREWQIPVTVSVRSVAELAAGWNAGVEEAARHARYDFLAELARALEVHKLVLGHNADDQAETVLMHLLRGAGLQGLRGILPCRNIDDAAVEQLVVVRPLLRVPRAAIEAYCREQGLAPRRDSSNQDQTLLRNRLRHQVLPFLEGVAPGAARHLCQLAELAAADVELLDAVLDAEWPKLVRHQSSARVSLDLARWRELPLSLRRNAVRRALAALRATSLDLGFHRVESARRCAEEGRTGARVALPGGFRARIDYQELVIEADQPGGRGICQHGPLLDPGMQISLAVPGRVTIPGTGWCVSAALSPVDPGGRATALSNPDPWRAYLDASVAGPLVTLRTRHRGEQFQPLGLGGHSTLVSDFMVNARIPAALRDGWPLVCREGTILWIPGHRLDNRARITQQTTTVLCIELRGGQGPD